MFVFLHVGFSEQRLFGKIRRLRPPHPPGVSSPNASDVGAVGGGRGVHLAAQLLDVVEGRVAGADLAAEHLLVGFAEVLRQERVDDGVDGRVAVRQAVGGDPKHEGGLVEREGPELDPQVHHVVRQPGEAEDHHHHQDRLSRLEDTKRHNSALIKQRLLWSRVLANALQKPGSSRGGAAS